MIACRIRRLMVLSFIYNKVNTKGCMPLLHWTTLYNMNDDLMETYGQTSAEKLLELWLVFSENPILNFVNLQGMSGNFILA